MRLHVRRQQAFGDMAHSSVRDTERQLRDRRCVALLQISFGGRSVFRHTRRVLLLELVGFHSQRHDYGPPSLP
jgi:hypothetical protein